MFDTSPLLLAKGETKPFSHLDIDNKTLESWFDLHPALETSFDLTEFVTGAASESFARDSIVPDSVVLTATVASSPADLLTLSSAATSQHLAEIERRAGPSSSFVSQPSGPVPVTSPSGHHHHHHQPLRQRQQPHTIQQQQQLQGYQQSLSPSLVADEVSQALSDDSCVFMPEFVPPTTASQSTWGARDSFFTTTVKTEDLGLTACSLEASLPGFTATASTSTASSSSYSASDVTKMEVGYGCEGVGTRYSRADAYGGATPHSPAHSTRTLSESSTATTSTLPDSPRRRSSGSKAGTKRRNVPKGSEEYKEKRARNNVAVRKSRAKAKEKQRVTESRVKELSDQNELLTKKVEMLTKELTVLRGLFINIGATLPDEFARLLEEQSS